LNSHKKIWFEVDGIAHFEQVAKWKTPEHNRKRDLYKMKCANKNGFSIIRILQEDIFKNRYHWLIELCDNIEKITKDDRDRVQNIYMCKNDEYKDFDVSI
jgi:very-short-patch-repair endonuclease